MLTFGNSESAIANVWCDIDAVSSWESCGKKSCLYHQIPFHQSSGSEWIENSTEIFEGAYINSISRGICLQWNFLLTFMHRWRMSALVLDLLLVIKEARTKRRHGNAKLISSGKKGYGYPRVSGLFLKFWQFWRLCELFYQYSYSSQDI